MGIVNNKEREMKQLNTAAADDNKRGAALNAYFRNREMACTYTREQQCLAQRTLDILDTAFAYAESYINYRKKFIAVKISGAIKRDRKMAAEAISIFEDKGYDVVSTPQGIVVRIPR
jgi:hypothetical protein